MSRPSPAELSDRRGWLYARRVGNWCNLSTPLGLVVAKLGGARIRRGPQGLFLAEGYRLPFPAAGAFTVGDVVTTVEDRFEDLEHRFPNVLTHEESHSWQYAYCGGLPFLPLYVGATAWSWLRTGDRASRNMFERQANLAHGGYPDHPIRPLRAAFSTGRARSQRTAD